MSRVCGYLTVVMPVLRSVYDGWTEEQRAEVQCRVAVAALRELAALGRATS